ncbi:hypothetical protein [Deinococcus arenicola]|uniref:DUF4231 domain-containing protein n=1 Tax=Deinococcus arenicola TaxID=2994950 RepID=A0ABU4DSJ3_9DEIO|nr:hypothetical protein [Deinococcus sp. ZS9-10]MDV6375401.1 hypothetical protein [Deinococcus sp. ZS9-10]
MIHQNSGSAIDEDSLETATRAAQAHDELVAHLMVFSRASLNFVADEFRDREARVARRTGLVVGPAQAGGILGLIGLGIAATSTLNRAFSDNGLMSRPVQDLTWVVLLVILSRSVTALLVRHNTSALLNYSDILQRVSSAKALLHVEEEYERIEDEDEGTIHAAEQAREDREIQAQVQIARPRAPGRSE